MHSRVRRSSHAHTAVFVSSRNVPPHKRLLRTEPHSFPAVNQLEFSSHFLEGVRAKVTPLNHSFPFIGAACVNDRTMRAVKGIFVNRELLVLFLVNCEITFLFLVKRDFGNRREP